MTVANISGIINANLNRSIYINGKQYHLFMIEVKRKSGISDFIVAATRSVYEDGTYVSIQGYLERRSKKKEKDGIGMTFIVSENDEVSEQNGNSDINEFQVNGMTSRVSSVQVSPGGKRRFRNVTIIPETGCSVRCIIWQDKDWNLEKDQAVSFTGRFQGRMVSGNKASFEIVSNCNSIV